MKLKGNILVLTSWGFQEALIQAYTLPYLEIVRQEVPAASRLILVTEEKPATALRPEEVEKIREEWREKNMDLLPFPYRRFGIRKIISYLFHILRLIRIIRKNKIEVIHVFCTPAGSMGYVLSRLTGRKLLVDSYEPHAESMVENGSWKPGGLAYRILFRFEKWITRRAVCLIGTTAGMKEYAKTRFGVSLKHFFVKPACVDLEQFSPGEQNPALMDELGLGNKIVGVYAGKFGGIYFREEIFRFAVAAFRYWGEKFRFLVLSDTHPGEIRYYAQTAGLPEQSLIHRHIPHKQVPAYLSLAHFGINPVKPVPSKRYCTSVKDGEYWAMGLPVVISPGISDDSDIIQRRGIGVITDFTKDELFPDTLKELDRLLIETEGLQMRIRETAREKRSYAIARTVYQSIYASE